jgi:hypothetical protein
LEKAKKLLLLHPQSKATFIQIVRQGGKQERAVLAIKAGDVKKAESLKKVKKRFASKGKKELSLPSRS